MEYRTQEQFEEIYASIINGQHTQAAEQCVEYGLFHQDLKNAYDNLGLSVGNTAAIVRMIEDAWKLGRIAELAQQIRGEESMKAEKG